jgi:hypothetical protein
MICKKISNAINSDNYFISLKHIQKRVISLSRKHQRSVSGQGLQIFAMSTTPANDKAIKEIREKHDQPHQTTYNQLRLF